ncbi:hypothetical protein LINPERPRIM_LOCUS18322 [Linum perenne]
MSLIFSRAST